MGFIDQAYVKIIIKRLLSLYYTKNERNVIIFTIKYNIRMS